MKILVIEKQTIKQNLGTVKSCAVPGSVFGMLCCDALGTGLVEMARLLRDEGISRFAVSGSEEAQALRKAGFVEEELFTLRSTTDREELERLMDLNVICTIGSTDAGMVLNSLAENRSTVAEAQIQVDLGDGCGGFLAEEPDKILAIYQNLPNVAISGIYTHCLHGDSAPRSEQFSALLDAILAAGFETGVLRTLHAHTLLGYDPAPADPSDTKRKSNALQRIGYGEVPLEDLRWLPKGHLAGGAAPIRLRRATRVATLNVGYLNGFGMPRNREGGLLALLRRWWHTRKITVRVGNQKVKLLGQVGALETMLDVTDLKCATGDLAYFDLDPLYAKGFRREYR